MEEGKQTEQNKTGTEEQIHKVSWWQRVLVGANIKFTFIRIVVLIVLVTLTIKFVAIPVRCEGISMEPNYHDRSVHLVYRLAYHHSKPQRGDVVSITITGEKILLMKRVIGLPGERVSIRQGIVYINGQALDEPWMRYVDRAPWNRDEVLLRPDEYLVIGDNRTMPMQNHAFGEVLAKRIMGKVVR